MNEAFALPKKKTTEEATRLLRALLESYPHDPDINYQMAWACDFTGKEAEAVSYYEKALSYGLVEDRVGAMLGLGSTYRCLGEYEKSLKIFDQAIDEFPEHRAFQIFRALTLFNLGRADESVGLLLTQLLDTTADASIKAYDQALRFYSNKLNETWK